MDISFIKGVIPPLLTPVDANDKIDEAKLRKQVNCVIDGGVHGILAFGSNGEFYMFDDAEYERGLKIILDETKGRVPVYLGIGAIRTGKCIELAKMGKQAGVNCISVLQPMFLKPTEKELRKHFVAIAESVPDTPMLLYNNPGRTGYGMSTQLVSDLAHNVNNIVGMKDSSGDVTMTSEFIRMNRDVDFKVFGGKDTLIYAALAHGAAGAVATNANMFTELVCSIYEKYVSGDVKGALEAQFRLNPVRISMDKASFPVATKDMANLMGMDVGAPILPTMPSEENIVAIMRDEMKKAGLL